MTTILLSHIPKYGDYHHQKGVDTVDVRIDFVFVNIIEVERGSAHWTDSTEGSIDNVMTIILLSHIRDRRR